MAKECFEFYNKRLDLFIYTMIASDCSNVYHFTVRLSNFAFVPKCDPTSTEDVRRLKKFVDKHHRLCVLTGAGISTESGIPDYRSAEVGLYARNNRKQILYQEFCDSEAIRRRYWARNYIGWPRFVFL